MLLLALIDFIKYIIIDIPFDFIGQITSFFNGLLSSFKSGFFIFDMIKYGVVILNTISGSENIIKMFLLISTVLLPIELLSSLFWWLVVKIPILNIKR